MKAIDKKIFIRPTEIQEIYGISRSTAYRLMTEDKFPKLIKLTERCRAWRKEELDKHFNIA
jgi:predicted DNA-binding transcriptional regulator AlpA